MKDGELKEILKLHSKWLRDDAMGQRANLGGANLWRADLWRADLEGANLEGADLQGANLEGANLEGANLEKSNLEGANLRGANLNHCRLQGANLQKSILWGVNLGGANLEGADLPLPDLYLLKEQSGRLIAYKFLESDFRSPFESFQYALGKTYSTTDYDADERTLCGAGFNIATKVWCLDNMKEGQILVKVSFQAKNIVAIPYATDGKFRVKRIKIEGIEEVQE